MTQSIPRAISEPRSNGGRSSQAAEDLLRESSNFVVSVETVLAGAAELERRMRET